MSGDGLGCHCDATRSRRSEPSSVGFAMRLRFEHGRRDDLKTLHPAYFAMVMATGIVSIATDLHGIPVFPKVLVWLNALFLSGLAAVTCARVLRYSRAFADDIQSHSRAVGFLTTAA